MKGTMVTCPFGPLNCTRGGHKAVYKRSLVKLERFLRLSRDLGRWYLVQPDESTCVVNFAPIGINRWSSKREEGSTPMISILFGHASDINRPFGSPEVGVARRRRTSQRRGVVSKKSRRCLTETVFGGMCASVNDVRLVMSLQGSSVRVDPRLNVRSEEKFPLRSAGVSTGLYCGEFAQLPPIDRCSRRGAGRDRREVMSYRFMSDARMDRDSSRPIARGMIWWKGSWGAKL